jgi:predicted dithiol-disulfide oxidoreductase (DUF899 family)
MMVTLAQQRIKHPKLVSPTEWIQGRKESLIKEMESTRLRDKLSHQRRELPREKVNQRYEFDGPEGKLTLADLFETRSQLVIYHFMLGQGWKEGFPSCSYLADHFDGMSIHLAHRDVRLAVVSHAPYAEIAAFEKRMGGVFPGTRRSQVTSIMTTRSLAGPKSRLAVRCTRTIS